MTPEPTLFDDPRARALQERERLLGEEKQLLAEWGGLDPIAPPRRTVIDARLREIRRRLEELRVQFPRPPVAEKATRHADKGSRVHDGRLAAAGEERD